MLDNFQHYEIIFCKEKTITMKSLYMYVIHRDQIIGGKKRRIEEVHFKYRIQRSLYDQSTFVVDMGRQKLEKTRLDRSYDEVITYLAKSHEEVARYKEIMDAANAAKVEVVKQTENNTPVEIVDDQTEQTNKE